jgi:hypothetical protein
MGMKIKRRNQLGFGLEKYAKRSTRALRRVQWEGANEIAETASEMAPFKTGDLESSMEILREAASGGRVTYVVRPSPSILYATRMHESVYNLGPGSVEKSKSSRFPVGRKYLSRAVDYVINDLKLMERARRAVRMK